MNVWVGLILSFTTGLVLGGAIAFSRYKAKLRFYKQFIEKRLGTTFRDRPSKPLTRVSNEFPTWVSVSNRHSKSRKESDDPQDK